MTPKEIFLSALLIGAIIVDLCFLVAALRVIAIDLKVRSDSRKEAADG